LVRPCCYCFLLCLAFSGPLLLGAAPPTDPASEAEWLIAQLGSEKFSERKAASKRLEALGEPALDALHKAMRSDDLEVRHRARRIVTAVENELYPGLRLAGHTSEVWCVCVSADSKRLLTSSADRTLRLWDATTGKHLRAFTGHTGCIKGAALSP